MHGDGSFAAHSFAEKDGRVVELADGVLQLLNRPTNLGKASFDPGFSQSTSSSGNSVKLRTRFPHPALPFEHPSITATENMDAVMEILKDPSHPLLRWGNCPVKIRDLSSNSATLDQPPP
jgi:hypothetical protein